MFTKCGAISMANITNKEMLSSRAKQTADRELMRLKRNHQEVLSELRPELQIVRGKCRAALESFEITNLAMEKICEPGAKASAEDTAVAKGMSVCCDEISCRWDGKATSTCLLLYRQESDLAVA